MSDSPLVLVEHIEPHITIITLNRPEKRNALNIELIEQLERAITAAAAEPRRRVLLLQANGPAFCAGLDLKEAADERVIDSAGSLFPSPGTPGEGQGGGFRGPLGAVPPPQPSPGVPGEGDIPCGMRHAPTDAQGTQRSAVSLANMYKALCRCPLTTIAAAQGAAMGGGAGILSACDLVVAADDLSIAYPEVHRGLVAALVMCLLRRQISDRHLRELILLGQAVTATRAREMALVNQVVPASELRKSAVELARSAAAASPTAVAQSKRLLAELNTRPIEAELDQALAFHLSARHSPDALEGMRAFAEKRSPSWVDRCDKQ